MATAEQRMETAVESPVYLLRAGQVISMPDSGPPSSIVAGVTTLKDARMIELLDLETGEPVETRLILGSHRMVVLHEIVVAHHYYKNESGQTIDVRLGLRNERVAPGETLHYTGRPKPALFGEGSWRHTAEPVEIAQEDRPV